jgi:hypothetical protein
VTKQVSNNISVYAKLALLAACVISVSFLATAVPVNAEGLPPEPTLMNAKGYSPELITATSSQRLRQEWQPQAKPYRTWWQQLKRNVSRNDWTGQLDQFGAPSFKDD